MLCILCMVVFLLAPTNGMAQTKVYATTATTTTATHTTGVTSSYDQNLATAAELSAFSGVLLGASPYTSNIELSFPSELTSDITTYVKIATDEPNILNGLLGGSLGAVLSALLAGQQEFTVEVKNNAGTVVHTGQSQVAGDFNTAKLSVVVDAAGNYLLKIAPGVPYKHIKFTNRYATIIGTGITKKLYVYEAYHVTGIPVCLPDATYTSTNGSGISASLLNSGTVGVVNPQNAIDANTTNFSTLNMGLVSVGGTIEQVLHFDVASGSTDSFAIRFALTQSLITAGALSNMTIVASNGTTVVQTKTLTELLTLNVLTPVADVVNTVYMTPGAAVNRITVRISSVASVSQSLKLYGVTRTLGPPVITQNPAICQGSTATLILTGTLTGTTINWYTSAAGGTPVLTSASGQSVATPVLNANTTYYVQQVVGGCTGVLTAVTITVVTKPSAGTIVGEQTICLNKVPTQITSSAADSGTGITYRWESSLDGNTWSAISGATLVTYQPGALNKPTFFRRITIRTASGVNCESATAAVKITAKNCMMITNPMVAQRVRNGA